MRILGICSYNGTNYQGWAKQPGKETIQGLIEMCLSSFFNREIKIQGAGRTDAGVHALGQRFHFDIDIDEIDLDRLLYSLNMMLPPDINVEDLIEVDEDFHARFSAIEKIYGYSIILRPKDVMFYQLMYTCPYSLDINLLKETLTHFIGEHNFKNFTSKPQDKDGFIRNIYDIKVDELQETVSITFRGNGFMRYMIRYIVGCAIEVARGKMNIEEIDELLDENSERHVVSYKAPSCGLALIDVKY